MRGATGSGTCPRACDEEEAAAEAKRTAKQGFCFFLSSRVLSQSDRISHVPFPGLGRGERHGVDMRHTTTTAGTELEVVHLLAHPLS